MSADHPLASGDFLQEDIFVCEQLQKSLTSPMYKQGPSAEYGESSIRAHQVIVDQYINKHSMVEQSKLKHSNLKN